jgi:hypothetical protein
MINEGNRDYKTVMTSGSGRLNPGNHWRGVCVGPTDGLDYTEKGTFLTQPGFEL